MENYSLRNLKDDFLFRFRAIEALGESVDKWDTLLLHILTSKLDTHTDERCEQRLFARKIKKPTLNILIEFLADDKSNVQTYNKPNH